MKKKYLEGTGWHYVGNHHAYHYRQENNLYALVEFHEVIGRVPVDYDNSGKILVEKGSLGLMKITNDKFSSSVVYDKHHVIQEWYFDMIVSRGYDIKPFMLDAYLDVAVSPDRQATLLDDDELEDAYDKDLISRADKITAYETGSYIMNHLIHDDKYMIHDFNQLKDDMIKEKDYYLKLAYNIENNKELKYYSINIASGLSTDENYLVAVDSFDRLINAEDLLVLFISHNGEHHDVYNYFDHNVCFKKVEGQVKTYYYPIEKMCWIIKVLL